MGGQFFKGLTTTVAFVVIIALLLMGVFIVVNFIAGPIGG
jgi:hypothetical protein